MAGQTRPVIVAMKGHPGTGKSTLARAVSSTLRCPLLDKDDVRDCTLPLQPSLDSTTTTTTTSSAALLNDLSYSVIWRIAETQLNLGLTLVLDSPLSRPAHLDHLVQLADRTGAGIVIIECRPQDEAEWRRRLESRGASAGQDGSNWHKPSTWQDLLTLVEGYKGCTNYAVNNVPRLVLDTTQGGGIGELVSSVVEFIKTSVNSGEQFISDL